MAAQSISSAQSPLGSFLINPADRGHPYAQTKTLLPSRMRELVTYYEAKTKGILDRYGPGPRVHFHTGFTGTPPIFAGAPELRAQLVEAQEEMLKYAAEAWRVRSVPFRAVLDVGCGLGGGAIFWAQEFGAKVTAVTIAPSHIGIVRRFAAQAGVDGQITPLLCNALSVPGENCFDAAVAIDSSSSFSRVPWFQRLSRILRPGGRVFIFDCFLVSPEYEQLFNRHWCAAIGTLEEYLAAAREAHFTLEMLEDVSARALHFWTTTLALTRLESQQRILNQQETTRVEESLRAHGLMRDGLTSGGLRHALLSLVRA